jgi:glucose/arabinose dehydrogenase
MTPMRWAYTVLLLTGGVAGGACGDDSGGRAADARPSDGSAPDAAAPDGPEADARPRPTFDCEPRSGTNVVLRRFATLEGLGGSLLVTSPPGDPRLFVVNHDGQIRIVEDEVPRETPFLDVNALIALDNEQGLLGLAFHPDYDHNRTFYIFYASATENVLARYTTRADDPYVADPDSAEILLAIPDHFPNHNGGMLEFGADGYLYISTGDGGGRSDPDENAENPMSLLGKILRIDVDHPSDDRLYGIPADNPFVAGGGAPEVYMFGLRNPWRWSFDDNGDMYIADVGFETYEELDIVPAGTGAGLDFGWDRIEGNGHCQEPATGCSARGTTLPVYEWTHDGDGFCAIIGGAVYRGACYPDLVGTYLFTDFCSDFVWALRAEGGAITQAPAPMPDTMRNGLVSLHESATGELYLTSNAGALFHIEVGDPADPAPAE